MKRLTLLLTTAALLSALPGCCCLWPWHGCGNSCNNGCGNGCAPGFGGGPAYVPQSTNYQTYDAVSGLPASTTMAYQPAPAVSLGPMEALPTYR